MDVYLQDVRRTWWRKAERLIGSSAKLHIKRLISMLARACARSLQFYSLDTTFGGVSNVSLDVALLPWKPLWGGLVGAVFCQDGPLRRRLAFPSRARTF